MQPIDFDFYFRTLADRREPILDGLTTVTGARTALERVESMLVDRARRRGCSWTEVGLALGISPEAARARHDLLAVERADGF